MKNCLKGLELMLKSKLLPHSLWLEVNRITAFYLGIETRLTFMSSLKVPSFS